MSDHENNHAAVMIIGSGPAGYTAAVYAARAGLEPVMYAGMQPGGQLMLTTDVENYPGFPDGIMGPEMMEHFRKQAERFGTKIMYNMVEKVDLSSQPKKVWGDNDEVWTADSVIVSTGASAKWLGLESEQRLMGGGVSSCAVCDGFFYKGEEVAIVGGGDSAAEEALYLAKICKTVHMLVRRDELRASTIMGNRVKAAENIKIYWNTEADEVLGKEVVEGVRVKNNQTGETQEISVKGFFVAIGHTPNTDIFKGQLDMEDTGYLKVTPGSTKTNLPGVFAGGDVQDDYYRQAVTAAGTGCMAALDAERWLGAQGLD